MEHSQIFSYIHKNAATRAHECPIEAATLTVAIRPLPTAVGRRIIDSGLSQTLWFRDRDEERHVTHVPSLPCGLVG